MSKRNKDHGIETDKMFMKRQPEKKSEERLSHYQDGVKLKRRVKKGGHYAG